MDWDDITSAKGAGAKPGRVTLGAWLGLAVLVALHATLFVVGIVTWSSPCSYPLAPSHPKATSSGAWTCSLFFRQWALFVKSGRAPTGMCACFHAAASISVGAALTVVTVIFLPMQFISGVYGMNFQRRAARNSSPRRASRPS